MNVEEAALRLAEELVVGEGEHQVSTLNPAKVRVLAAIHHLGGPRTQADLVTALGWSERYVYRMVSELSDQGVLIRFPDPNYSYKGFRPILYQCACSLNQEGIRP